MTDSPDSPTRSAPEGAVEHPILRVTADGALPTPDWIADEVPVALVYNGISHAVMMATPSLLEEFALGFSLTEGIIKTPADLYSIEVTEGCRGGKNVEVTIAADCFWHLKERRRSLVGRTGCGLCGVESLSEAVRTAPQVPDTQRFSLHHYRKALCALRSVQHVGDLTGATHAAVWVTPEGKVAGGTEDVGRHVALDKLLGLRAKNNWRDGALVVSSRASYEMVQKAAMCGVEILFAVSAPTRLAVEMAQKCGMTLAAFCREGTLNVYSHPERLTDRITSADAVASRP